MGLLLDTGGGRRFTALVVATVHALSLSVRGEENTSSKAPPSPPRATGLDFVSDDVRASEDEMWEEGATEGCRSRGGRKWRDKRG